MPTPIRFYTTESLGTTSKRAWTPEGFLLCQSVPIARVGVLLYGRGEIPIQPNMDGIIRIIRDPDEVFHDNAVLSFAGKPVTDEHPPTKVTPDNWRQYTIGTVLHPHQGDGGTEDNQLLYADLLIQDRAAIQDVLQGKREVSAGYDAEYEQIKPGEGKQHNIIGNHVALVARGRCGPVCSIGDAIMAKVQVHKRSPQARRVQAFRDRIMEAFQTGDEETLVDELEKVPEMMGETAEGSLNEIGNVGFSKGKESTSDEMGGTHVHIHTGGGMVDDGSSGSPPPPAAAPGGAAPPAPGAPPGAPPPAAGGAGGVTLESLGQRMDQLEQAIAILAQGEGDDPDDNSDPNAAGDPSSDPSNDPSKPPTGDRRAMVGDSSSMVIAFQEVMQRAELLSPGQRHPTFDARKPARVTAQSMCDFRRTTLDNALNKGDDAKDAIMAIAGKPRNPGQYIKQMSCDAVTMVFNGASEMIRTSGLRGNNGTPAPTGLHHGGGTQSVLSVADTVANINKLNRERYNVTGR